MKSLSTYDAPLIKEPGVEKDNVGFLGVPAQMRARAVPVGGLRGGVRIWVEVVKIRELYSQEESRQAQIKKKRAHRCIQHQS